MAKLYFKKSHFSVFCVGVLHTISFGKGGLLSDTIFPLICHPLWHFIACSCYYYCLLLCCMFYMNLASSMSKLLNTLLEDRHQTLRFFSHSLHDIPLLTYKAYNPDPQEIGCCLRKWIFNLICKFHKSTFCLNAFHLKWGAYKNSYKNLINSNPYIILQIKIICG